MKQMLPRAHELRSLCANIKIIPFYFQKRIFPLKGGGGQTVALLI